MDVARGVDPSPIIGPGGICTLTRLEMPPPTRRHLVAALDDEVITEEEWAMLDTLEGNMLGIQPDQHALIEEAIRTMSDSDDSGERRLERLERFNTVCPFY